MDTSENPNKRRKLKDGISSAVDGDASLMTGSDEKTNPLQQPPNQCFSQPITNSSTEETQSSNSVWKGNPILQSVPYQNGNDIAQIQHQHFMNMIAMRGGSMNQQGGDSNASPTDPITEADKLLLQQQLYLQQQQMQQAILYQRQQQQQQQYFSQMVTNNVPSLNPGQTSNAPMQIQQLYPNFMRSQQQQQQQQPLMSPQVMPQHMRSVLPFQMDPRMALHMQQQQYLQMQQQFIRDQQRSIEPNANGPHHGSAIVQHQNHSKTQTQRASNAFMSMSDQSQQQHQNHNLNPSNPQMSVMMPGGTAPQYYFLPRAVGPTQMLHPQQTSTSGAAMQSKTAAVAATGMMGGVGMNQYPLAAVMQAHAAACALPAAVSMPPVQYLQQRHHQQQPQTAVSTEQLRAHWGILKPEEVDLVKASSSKPAVEKPKTSQSSGGRSKSRRSAKEEASGGVETRPSADGVVGLISSSEANDITRAESKQSNNNDVEGSAPAEVSARPRSSRRSGARGGVISSSNNRGLVMPPWLISIGPKKHSDAQRASGADLSKIKKKYRDCQCEYCLRVFPTSAWALVRTRKHEHEIFKKHEKSNQHRQALLELNKMIALGYEAAQMGAGVGGGTIMGHIDTQAFSRGSHAIVSKPAAVTEAAHKPLIASAPMNSATTSSHPSAYILSSLSSLEPHHSISYSNNNKLVVLSQSSDAVSNNGSRTSPSSSPISQVDASSSLTETGRSGVGVGDDVVIGPFSCGGSIEDVSSTYSTFAASEREAVRLVSAHTATKVSVNSDGSVHL